MVKSILLLSSLIMSPIIKGQHAPADSVLQVISCNDFELTGDGSNPEWKKTGWQPLAQLRSKSPYRTQFKMLYSQKGVYCLFDCEDKKITATMKGDNLDLWNEDVIEAFFWADQSLPVYFEYELSPLNYELVLMVPNYNGRFLGWIPWHYEGSRVTRHAVSVIMENDQVERWYGEFFIPYELMKPMVAAAPKKGEKWRANFYRIDYDDIPGNWAWMPVKKNFHDYLLFGTIEFR
jgi:hypothetical protein